MDALGDLDLVVERDEVVLADAAGVVGERLRRVERASWSCGPPGAGTSAPIIAA